MSDATAGAPIDRRLIKGRHSVLARTLLFLCLAAFMAFAAMRVYQTYLQTEAQRDSERHVVASIGLVSAGHKTLAAKFSDKEGRLMADPPASSAEFMNPETLVVAHIEGADETPGNSWADWEARLALATGKKVTDQTYNNSAGEVAAAASGKVTLLALHAADTPFLVNNYGFEPMAVLADQTGINGNRLDLIVAADSHITKPAELKGHRLVCTVPSSITGYRAAIAVLMRDYELRPNVDYELIWSLGQKKSILGITRKKFDASAATNEKPKSSGEKTTNKPIYNQDDVAAVSDDKLKSLLEKGTIKESDYKIIYQSPVIPRTTIGCFYNLNPTLAEQLRKAILAPPAAAATDPTAAVQGMSFITIDYKHDFQFVRDINDEFDPRFDAQKASHE